MYFSLVLSSIFAERKKKSTSFLVQGVPRGYSLEPSINFTSLMYFSIFTFSLSVEWKKEYSTTFSGKIYKLSFFNIVLCRPYDVFCLWKEILKNFLTSTSLLQDGKKTHILQGQQRKSLEPATNSYISLRVCTLAYRSRTFYLWKEKKNKCMQLLPLSLEPSSNLHTFLPLCMHFSG